jgi:hypothetical protein
MGIRRSLTGRAEMPAADDADGTANNEDEDEEDEDDDENEYIEGRV